MIYKLTDASMRGIAVSQKRRLALNGISAEIVEEKRNDLIGRRELKLRLDHTGQPTPKRTELRSKIAELLGVSVERIVIKSVESSYGAGISVVEVNIYDTPERLKRFESEYILKRNEV